MRKKIMPLFLLTILMVACSPSKTYVEKVYFDKRWRTCNKSEASYYRLMTIDPKYPDKPISLVKDYYITGELQWQGKISRLAINPQDTVGNIYEGETIRYYKNGQISDKEPFKEGKLSGKLTSWYEDGTIKQQGKYSDGKKEGKWEYFHENGKLWQRAEYKEGKLVDRFYKECDIFSLCKKVFHEDFTNSDSHQKWDLPNKKDYNTYIKNPDGLIMNVKQDERYVLSITSVPVNTSEDFSISTEISLLYSSGWHSPQQGLVWGYKNWDNYSAFLINSNGTFLIRRVVEGVRVKETNWSYSSYIKQGVSENELTILRENNTLYFSINGHVVYKMKFSSFYGNNFGFIAGFSQKVLFKNLIVKQNYGL